MREAFEKWYGENYSTHALKSWHVNHYANFDTELAWQSYQAAFAAIKEGGPVAWKDTIHGNLHTQSSR